MKQRACRETERIKQLDMLTAEDRGHLSSCKPCSEYLTVSSAMRVLAKETGAELSPMPSAQAVFIRARIAGKRKLASQSARPLMVFQRVASAIIGLCWVGFLMVQWTPFTRWLGGIGVSLSDGIQITSPLPLNFFWMFAALSLMTMTTMIHGYWTDDMA